MIKIEKPTMEHLEYIMANCIEPLGCEDISRVQMESLLKNEHSRVMISPDGIPLMCWGVLEYWPGRAECWGALSKDCVKHYYALRRACIKVLDSYPYRRIEASIQPSFEKGHRWALALGFKLELAERKNFFSNGASAALYARLK